ncbi:MAG: DUF3857 domain-containing protein [Kiritimatiellae bacterium]|nr:DUF3857 domain-containing protein [Kiritimatiellia bacterium]
MIALFLAALPLMPVADRAPVPSTDGISASAYPDADVVTLADRTCVQYEPDGTFTEWNDEWRMALTEKGRRALRTVTLGVSRRYGDAEIQTVEIVGTNGVLRVVDFAKTLKEATDNSSMGMNIYDPLDRVLSCGVPDVGVGETRHLTTCRRTTRPMMRNAFSSSALLESTQPVLSASFAVDAPPGLPIAAAKLRHPLSNTVTRLPDRPLPNGRTRSEWVATRVPQAFPEPNMPAFSSVAQKVIVSTNPDWPAVSRWYWNLCLPHLEKTDAAMTNKVRELVRDCPDRTAKIRAIFKFVSQEVRYMGLTLEEESPGFAPHDVSITFHNRYGVCRDKAALLASLFRIAGFEAYPVLIMVGPKLDEDVPTPFFNHAITWCEGQLMDATAESTKDLLPAYLMNRSYLVAHPEGRGIAVSPITPPSDNALRADVSGTLQRDGSATISATLRFGGINDNAYRGAFLKMTPVQRRLFFERNLQSVAEGAEVLACDVKPDDLRNTDAPLTASLTARVPDLVLKGETRRSLVVPLLSTEFGVANFLLAGKTALAERRFPLVVSTTAEVAESLTLEFDGDALGDALALPPEVDYRAGGYRHVRTLAVTNGTLRATCRTTVADLEYAPADYLKLRDAKKEIETATRAHPLFAPPDPRKTEHLFERLYRADVELLSPHDFVTTRETVVEVLDAQGKRSAAEKKFSFNPLLGGVEILSATVSNRDGRVHCATAKEMNVMDAGWVASAPRYPAGKTLVVNLPSVEIGSVIRMVVRSVVTNSPLPWTSLVRFDDVSPIGKKELRVHGAPFTVGNPFGKRRLEPVLTNDWSFVAENPKPLPRESSTAPSLLWRDAVLFSAGDFEPFGKALTRALEAARDAGSEQTAKTARELVAAAGADSAEAKIKAVRDHLFRRVRIAGPSFGDLPMDRSFSPPDVVLADGYATAYDWLNAYFAMLEAIGFDPEFALLGGDRGTDPALRALNRRIPQVDDFNNLVIRLSVREGGWWWPWGTVRTYWLDCENEYTPLGVRDYPGETAFLPASGTFETLPESDAPDSESRQTILLRENGDADFIVENRVWGVAVGARRKLYAEMLPEARARHFRAILGELAENAEATRELETELAGYPFARRYEAHVPGFATLQDGAMSVELAAFKTGFFTADEQTRQTPIGLASTGKTRSVFRIVFPDGYTEPEAIPEAWSLKLPGEETAECEFDVSSAVGDDGRLCVTLTRTRRRAADLVLPPEFAALLRNWNRRVASSSGRTVVVRKNAPNAP